MKNVRHGWRQKWQVAELVTCHFLSDATKATADADVPQGHS